MYSEPSRCLAVFSELDILAKDNGLHSNFSSYKTGEPTIAAPFRLQA